MPPLFRPLGSFAVRAPLLPVDRYLKLAAGSTVDQLLAVDPMIETAVCAASPVLGAALRRPARDDRRAAALAASLLRYVIRMSTRPTPFGLFAGIGLGRWGDATDLRLADGPRPTRTRPDMGWLVRLALDAERDPRLRERLTLVRHGCAVEHEGRIHLADRSTAGRPGAPDVSVRATPVVRRVLDHARRPVAFGELVEAVLAATPGATRERVADLVGRLHDQDLLVADLRPTLTGDPLRHVAARLAAPADLAGPLDGLDPGALDGIADQAAQLDRGGLDPAGLAGLRTRIRAVAPGLGDEDVVQVDAGLPLAGRTLCRAVAADAARAVDLLMRLHPAPGGPRHLAAYRSAFLARYGHGRGVPLLELLDPRFGLGPPETAAGHQPAGHQPAGGPQPAVRRAERLQELALTALRDGRREIELAEDDLAVLSTGDPRPVGLPVSLELSVFVLAGSAPALDAGEYTLVVGPNLGGQAAGRGLGRFADLLGDGATALLRDIAAAEAERSPPGVAAELVYLPARLRSANVAVRPRVHAHEIPVGVAPGVPADQVITPDELAVVVRDGRLRLWWPRGGAEVRVHAGHMLNSAGAPAVCRFLAEIGQDGVTPLTAFAWGPAATLPFLPRVRVGRIVLAPARWRLPRRRAVELLRIRDAAAFPAALDAWRAAWRVPRHVYLAVGDNRLLLDLDDPGQADLLCDELGGAGGDLVVQEALPGPDDAWLAGPGGRFVSELVVPMVRTRPAAPTPVREAPAAPAVGTGERRRGPGSDWLYLTLHGGRARHDELIAGPLRELADRVVGAGHATSWFFLRYTDPDHHLRVRLHGAPDALLRDALPVATSWAAGLMASGLLTRVGLDVYEREVERYGGAAGTDLAEALFAADSAAVSALLALRGAHGLDPVELAVLGVDDLLAALGMDEPTRLAWCTTVAPPPKETGAAYRRRAARLREMLSTPPAASVREILRRRTAALRPVAADLARLDAAGGLGVPVPTLARSFVHLHCNRLGVDLAGERAVLGLLRRTRASLAAAPPR